MPTLDDYKKLIKANECSWCGTSIEDEPIEMYSHDGGWTVDGEHVKKWLYIECPHPDCEYQWALSKLGVPREREE